MVHLGGGGRPVRPDQQTGRGWGGGVQAIGNGGGEEEGRDGQADADSPVGGEDDDDGEGGEEVLGGSYGQVSTNIFLLGCIHDLVHLKTTADIKWEKYAIDKQQGNML